VATLHLFIIVARGMTIARGSFAAGIRTAIAGSIGQLEKCAVQKTPVIDVAQGMPRKMK
jgi:hypothetical protein